MTKANDGNHDARGKESVSGSDRRIFDRLSMKDIKVNFKDLQKGTTGRCVCLDISGGGVTIECAQELQPQTPLQMRFELPDGVEPLLLSGKVSWSKNEGVSWRAGVTFDAARLMSLTQVLKFGT